MFFTATDDAHGTELWVSDGTAAGTRVAVDLYPGYTSSYPYALRAVGAGVAFCTYYLPGGLGGTPSWSDGTVEGTFVADANVPCDALRTRFVPSGPLVYFPSGSSAGGSELWALPLSALTSVRVGDCSLIEGGGGSSTCAFVVSLSGPLPDPVTLSYATADGSAVAGTDYVAASGPLTFAPGTTTQTIAITINGDSVLEPNEDFRLTLSAVSGAVLVDGSATGTILDDEAMKFHALTPCRLVDTRGAEGPALGAGGTRTFAVSQRCGVPSSAKGAAVNLTVVNPEDVGNLRAYAAGAAVPPASVINFAAGRSRANNAVVALGEDGSIAIRCDMPPGSHGTAHLVVDVFGYFE